MYRRRECSSLLWLAESPTLTVHLSITIWYNATKILECSITGGILYSLMRSVNRKIRRRRRVIWGTELNISCRTQLPSRIGKRLYLMFKSQAFGIWKTRSWYQLSTPRGESQHVSGLTITPTTLQLKLIWVNEHYRLKCTKRQSWVTLPPLALYGFVRQLPAMITKSPWNGWFDPCSNQMSPYWKIASSSLNVSCNASPPNFFMESLFTLFRSSLLSGNIPANWIPFSGSWM